MKILFMGTPDFAVPVLESLIQSDEHEVTCVVTQPDKAKGRGGKVTCTPVKEVALAHNIPCFQPRKIKEAESIAELKQYEFDCIVVVAFGQILSKEVLDLPKFGCINVHASLLPRWRGAAPIQWAIMARDKETGVTTMKLDEGVDTGNMLLQEKLEISPDETGGSLFERLAQMGGPLLLKTLDGIKMGTIKEIKQPEEFTYAKILTKEMGKIDFCEKAVDIEAQVRALNPWPSAYTFLQDKTLKIWKADVLSDKNTDSPAGNVVELTKDSIVVQTKEGCLAIRELQLEGKRRMTAKEFLCGGKIKVGDSF